MSAWWVPTYRVESVCQLTPDWLRQRDLRALLLDVDCTLKRYRCEQAGPDEERWLAAMRAARVPLCLVSNGRAGRIGRFAERYQVPCVAMALKPLPYGCRRALRLLGADPRQTALVGDQLLADVIAGRWAGAATVLVEPLHPEDEPWGTRLKRPLERLLLGRPRRAREEDSSPTPETRH